jgi:hypothetical protein
MLFYLGAPRPSWLGEAGVPLFVSYNTIGSAKRLPRAIDRWALDSGAYSQMKKGGWDISARTYANGIARLQSEVGNLDWAAPQDWLCDEASLKATGRSVRDHQRLTLESYLELSGMGAPVIPVLQGWTLGQYLDHVEAYEKAGVRLKRMPLVGIGSIKTRMMSLMVANTIAWIASDGIRLHGFGMSLAGLELVASRGLASADSMAWSMGARRRPEDEGGSNSIEAALAYRTSVLAKLKRMGVSVTNGGVVTAKQITRGKPHVPAPPPVVENALLAAIRKRLSERKR